MPCGNITLLFQKLSLYRKIMNQERFSTKQPFPSDGFIVLRRLREVI